MHETVVEYLRRSVRLIPLPEGSTGYLSNRWLYKLCYVCVYVDVVNGQKHSDTPISAGGSPNENSE